MRTNFVIAAVAAGVFASSAAAQTPAADPSARLAEVLPSDVAQHVLATIASARSRGLPAQALENRALKYASRGVDPAAIRNEIAAQAQRMGRAKGALESARGRRASDEEIEVGADVMAKGVDGPTVSQIAQSAPRDRSMVVPLFVLGQLIENGTITNSAVAQVREKLAARASDAELENLAGRAAASSRRPEHAGRGAGRPAGAGPGAGAVGGVGVAGPPSGIPVAGRPTPPAGRP